MGIVNMAPALIAPIPDNFPHNPVVTLKHCIKNVYVVPGEKCYKVGSNALDVINTVFRLPKNM